MFRMYWKGTNMGPFEILLPITGLEWFLFTFVQPGTRCCRLHYFLMTRNNGLNCSNPKLQIFLIFPQHKLFQMPSFYSPGKHICLMVSSVRSPLHFPFLITYLKFWIINFKVKRTGTTGTQECRIYQNRYFIWGFPKWLIEFTEFSDLKYLSLQQKGSSMPPLVLETSMLPQYQQDTCEREDL